MSRQGKLAALASTGVTKAELDLLDGVTSTTAELNITDGVTSTAAELNILDGVTATAAEINLIDGGTARGTTAVADGDGFLTNDGGTMRMTKVDTLATYMGTKITGGSKVFIASSGVLSNAASVSFTQFDASKFDHYEFMFQHILPATDNVQILGHASIDGGNSYDTTDGNYHHKQATDRTGFVMADQALGSASGEYGLSGTFHLFSPHLQFFTYGQSRGVMMNDDGAIYATDQADASRISTAHLSANDVNAIQFKFTSGNIESGEVVMYGIANGT